MNIVICGAGEVGSHAAETLAAKGHSITLIDLSADRLQALEETLDIRTLPGNCAEALVLREAGIERADMLVAATSVDEVNVLTASMAKALGAAKSIARVHHRAFFERTGLDYQQQFNIDRLICPEYSTALAIARTLRNPGAVAIENFARGAVEMQQFPLSRSAPAIGKTLVDIRLPTGTRLAAITRKGGTFIPDATTTIEREDTIILVGNKEPFHEARRIFHDEQRGLRRIVMMGGSPLSVWLSRSLRDRLFSIRLFVEDRRRAEELAEKLDWVTVIQADPTDRVVFEEERLSQADIFLALLESDERNIIAGVLARARGVTEVVTVLQQTKYLDIVFDVGVDQAFSPRMAASDEIDAVLDESPLRHMGSLAEGFVDVFRVKVGDRSPVIGKPLREVKLSPDWVVAAIQRDGSAHVPGADDQILRGDVVLVIGRHGRDTTLKRIFAAK